VVRIDPPPPDRDTDPLIHTLPAASTLLRIYRPQPFGSTPCGFRYEGPFSRFDHHCAGERRGIHYSAPTLSACVVEVFGDTGLIEPQGCRLALLRTGQPLTLLDLRGSGAMRAGSVAALSATADRKLSQQWSRYFYGSVVEEGRPLDGLLYSNAHNAEAALALYERAETAIGCEADLPLTSPQIRSRLLAIATRHAMTMAPPTTYVV
jgi:hypothetical protein